jgi:hypothetical protein
LPALRQSESFLGKMPPTVDPQQIQDAERFYVQFNGNLAAIEKAMRAAGYPNFSRQRIRKSDGRGGYTGWEIERNWPGLLEIKVTQTDADYTDFDEELLGISMQILKNLQAKLAKGADVGYQIPQLLERINEIRARRPAEVDRYANFLIFLEDLLKAAKRISPELTKALFDSKDALLDWSDREYGSN